MSKTPGSVATLRGGRRVLVPKVLRYLTGSVVATVWSEVAFVACFGLLALGTTWSSILSWLAGAVPNFWLNRNWAWQRSGRPSLRRELLPYLGIVLGTLLLATIATHATDVFLRDHAVSHSARVTLVASVFLGVYALVFALRFVMLEWLFTREPSSGREPSLDGEKEAA